MLFSVFPFSTKTELNAESITNEEKGKEEPQTVKRKYETDDGPKKKSTW